MKRKHHDNERKDDNKDSIFVMNTVSDENLSFCRIKKSHSISKNDDISQQIDFVAFDDETVFENEIEDVSDAASDINETNYKSDDVQKQLKYY